MQNKSPVYNTTVCETQFWRLKMKPIFYYTKILIDVCFFEIYLYYIFASKTSIYNMFRKFIVLINFVLNPAYEKFVIYFFF